MSENERRAERAYRALLAADDEWGGSADEIEEAMVDFLADLRHLADEYDAEWADLMRRVELHYSAEVA